jgi:hypothetical protein
MLSYMGLEILSNAYQRDRLAEADAERLASRASQAKRQNQNAGSAAGVALSAWPGASLPGASCLRAVALWAWARLSRFVGADPRDRARALGRQPSE